MVAQLRPPGPFIDAAAVVPALGVGSEQQQRQQPSQSWSIVVVARKAESFKSDKLLKYVGK